MTTATCRYQICVGAFWLPVEPGFSSAGDQQHWLLGSLYCCRRLLSTARTKQGGFTSCKDDHKKLSFLFMARQEASSPSSLLCSWPSRHCDILGHLPWNGVQSAWSNMTSSLSKAYSRSDFQQDMVTVYLCEYYRQQTQGLMDSCPYGNGVPHVKSFSKLTHAILTYMLGKSHHGLLVPPAA